jgi:hypothetical protein
VDALLADRTEDEAGERAPACSKVRARPPQATILRVSRAAVG